MFKSILINIKLFSVRLMYRVENNHISEKISIDINHILREKNLIINIDGKIYKIATKEHIINLMATIIVVLIIYILKQIPYTKITVTGTKVYSNVISCCLIRSNIDFVLCKGTNRITHYNIENHEPLPLEGPSSNYFSSLDTYVPLIQHTNEDILKLEQHTNLKYLSQIQSYIFKQFPNSSVKIKDLIFTEHSYKNPIKNIDIFCGILYITTGNDSWFSKILITDDADPLAPHEIVSSIDGYLFYNYPNQTSLISHDTYCLITDQQTHITTLLTRQEKYQIHDDLNITSILIISNPHTDLINSLNNNNEENDIENKVCCVSESNIYGLKNPRPFIKNNMIYNIHPFYLTNNWDPFLTIMITTLGLILDIETNK